MHKDTSHYEPTPQIDLSVVAPIYNERENIAPLADDIVRELQKLNRSFEVILVNDGSTDGSAAVLDEAAERHPQVRVIHFAGNRGQTIAIAAGFYYARGRVIVPIDGDRQNDPSDIDRLLQKLDEGFDCVSGWRKDRKDSGIRRLPSRIANKLVKRVTNVPVHDLGCTLKAYRRGALDPTELFGEMHRFLAVYVLARGGRIAELEVKHHPRRAGVSKYGLSRTARVVADLLLVRVLFKYRTRPSHLFAKIAQYFALAAGACAIVAMIQQYRDLGSGLSWLSALILAVGAVQTLVAGLIAELVIRARFAMTGQHPWQIARYIGFDNPPQTDANTDSPS